MNWPVSITDPRDLRIESYQNIRDRDLISGRGLFMAEGAVVLRRLLSSRAYAPQSALILANRLTGLADAVEQMRERGIPVYVASSEIMDAIAGFPVHRGVLAIGAAEQPTSVSDILTNLPGEATIVVCVGIANHDNIGAIFRNAAGLGASAVLYDKTSCDPFYRKAIRVSVGAVFDMPHASFENTDTLIEMLSGAGFQQIALTPSGKVEMGALTAGPRVALYLGAEGPGLPDVLLGKLDGVRIAMTPGFDSLNVATASAVALYQLRRRS